MIVLTAVIRHQITCVRLTATLTEGGRLLLRECFLFDDTTNGTSPESSVSRPGAPPEVAIAQDKDGSKLSEQQIASGVASFTEWCRSIQGFLDGRTKELSGIDLDYGTRTPFQRHVLETAMAIAWGTTVSYSELAARCGRAGAVRAVASTMRNNDFCLVVPCHRVVHKDGSIGGFGGSQNGANVELKRRLLVHEGALLR